MHVSLKKRFAIGVLVVLLLVAWKAHNYRPQQEARAASLNQGRTWEHKTRVDSKGVAQVWVPPGCFEMGSNPLEDRHVFRQ